jgi:hypothetical protein
MAGWDTGLSMSVLRIRKLLADRNLKLRSRAAAYRAPVTVTAHQFISPLRAVREE